MINKVPLLGTVEQNIVLLHLIDTEIRRHKVMLKAVDRRKLQLKAYGIGLYLEEHIEQMEAIRDKLVKAIVGDQEVKNETNQ